MKIGDRVGLKDACYANNSWNPWHSTTGTVGTVARIENKDSINVKWDNHERNTYYANDLFLVEKPIMDVEELFAEVVL